MKNTNSLTNSLTGTMAKTPSARLSDLSDVDLVGRFKRGDENAFSVLFARYKNPIFNFIFKYLGSEETAEEAFQEVFLRVIRTIGEYKTAAKFSTWLYTIARNYCIDHYRKEKFRDHLSLSLSLGTSSNETWQDRIESFEPGPEQASQSRFLAATLQNILAKINPMQREVFLLREFQGLSFGEIAHITGVSTNSVKSRMRYALMTLQKELAPILREGEV